MADDDEVKIDARFREPWGEESEELITKAKDAVLAALARVGPIRRHRANLVLDGCVRPVECLHASSVPLRGTLTFLDALPSNATGRIGTVGLVGRDVTVRIRSGSYLTNSFDFEELTGA